MWRDLKIKWSCLKKKVDYMTEIIRLLLGRQNIKTNFPDFGKTESVEILQI